MSNELLPAEPTLTRRRSRSSAISPPHDKPLAHLNDREWAHTRPSRRKRLEPGPPPLTFTAEEDAEYRRGFRAMRLAPTLEVYEALMAGEDVAVEAIDPKWATEYGYRRPAE